MKVASSVRMRERKVLSILALTCIEGVGPATIRHLSQAFSLETDPLAWTRASLNALRGIPGIGETLAQRLYRERTRALEQATQILKMLDRDQDMGIVLWDEEDYPGNLRQCEDAPPLLFYRGSPASWRSAAHLLTIVGTRQPDAWACEFLRRCVQEWARYQPVIVSGLAYGIDREAHQLALHHQLSTIAVLAHGLDRIYPREHQRLAEQIVEAGGALLSEYPPGQRIHPRNFPHRNRIIAGLSEATVVVQSGVPGGSLITAQRAYEYGRVVFAVPGRPTDQKSQGNLYLISAQIAQILHDPRQLVECLGWHPRGVSGQPRELFLLPSEQEIMDVLRASDHPLSVEEIARRTGRDIAEVLAILATLEMRQYVRTHPGMQYSAAVD